MTAELSALSVGLNLPPKEIPRYSFLLEAEWTIGSLNADKRIRSLKKFPRTPSGIEPETSHHVLQCHMKVTNKFL